MVQESHEPKAPDPHLLFASADRLRPVSMRTYGQQGKP